MNYRIRIAPTPSGYLHVGNALNAILIWIWARQHNASIYLRIDDIDGQRTRNEYLDDIFDSLSWLGIDWDEGPQNRVDFVRNWSQHHRIPLYDKTINTLIESNLVYACACSRSAWLSNQSCTCREYGVPDDSSFNLMLVDTRSTVTFDDAWNGTMNYPLDASGMAAVVRKKDGLPAYQITSITDDIHFGITHVIRGTDLLSSSALQFHLAKIVGMNEQIVWMHHPLITARGQKISKSDGATSLRDIRSHYKTPEILYKRIGEALGIGQPLSLTELSKAWDSNTPPVLRNSEW